MKKTLLILLICICSIGISFGQTKVSGNIYADNILKETISEVKVILKFGNKREVYKTDRNGKIDIVTKLKKFSIEIKKKGYASITVRDVSKDIDFDVILRRISSVHDKNYEGSSELIFTN